MPFPFFDDADVSIRFNATGKPWALHSYVLALHSPWFKASLSERWSDGSQHRRLYELRFEKDCGDGTLMREWHDGTEMIERPAIQPGERRIVITALLQNRRLAVRAHQMMFKTMYHVEPEMDLLWDAETRSFLQTLSNTADFYACSHIIDPRSDYFLRRHWTEVLKGCESAPITTLEFGLAIRCAWLVTECCTHLIAAPNASYTPLRKRLGELGMAAIVDAKRAEMHRVMKSIDRDLFCLTFSNVPDYDGLLALSLWRQWLADQLNASSRNYAEMYRHIGVGSARIIDLTDEDRTALVAMEDMETLKFNLDLLFGMAKKIVEPILVDRTNLQNQRGVQDYLVFEIISDSDLPWKNPNFDAAINT